METIERPKWVRSALQSANRQGDSAPNAAFLTAGDGAAGAGSYSAGYQYDPDGNRSQARELGTPAFSYQADAENRYQGSSYDANGCTSDSAVGWSYQYDAEGQMTSATRQSDGYTVGFAYDGVGRLIYQTSHEGLLIFCYAGSQRIEERSLANNASVYRYFSDAPGSDRITFRQQSNGQMDGGSRLYYQSDAAGNTTHVSDDGGNVVEQYLYDAYGVPYVYDKAGNYQGQTSPSDNRYLFHGSSAYEWLDAPGLYYCRARMYLPAHGRWLQPDPIGFRGGDLNLYRYCGNDPVNGCDSSGLVTVVGLYDNNVLVGAGHVSIGTSSDMSLGLKGGGPLWEYGTDYGMSGGFLTGEVGKNFETPNDIVILNTTPEQEKEINSYINQVFYKNPSLYAIAPSKNDDALSCATFVYRALRAAGVKVKFSRRPNVLFKNIQKAMLRMQKQHKPDVAGGGGGDSSSATSLEPGELDQLAVSEGDWVTLNGPGLQPGGDSVEVPRWQAPSYQVPDSYDTSSFGDGESGGGDYGSGFDPTGLDEEE